MFSKEVLKKIILQNQDFIKSIKLVRRDVPISKELIYDNNIGKIIIGPRRVGKTFFMYQIMKEMGKYDELVYINFEDSFFVDFTFKDFEKILQAYGELYPNKKPILFFDEIHNVDGWELFIRKLIDYNYNVFITGSNSKLLSKEYATKLSGRYVQIEIFPLSFKEFLKFKGIYINKFSKYKQEKELFNFFEEYLNYGGFPKVVLYSDSYLKRELLFSYMNSILLRDIVVRHNIGDEKVLEILVKKIAENVTNQYSFNSLEKIFKKLNIDVSRKTLINYHSYLKDAFFIFDLVQYRDSIYKREFERKSYFIDTGLLNLFYIKENKEKLMENLVAIDLIRKKYSIFYLKKTKECDFVVKDPHSERVKEAIQVTYELSDENYDREISGLKGAMDYFGLKEGLLLTYDQEDEIEVKGKNGEAKKIIVKPVWKWLLE